MKRKHKKYSKPKRPFDKQRIEEETAIRKEFGLKNKKDIWKAEANINSMRERAKNLVTADPEEQQKLFDRLNKIGIKVGSIADVLSLETKDYLKRRLQTILVTKKFATTPSMARQLITHKKVLINDKIVNKPSYVVPVEFEDKISLKPKKEKQKKKGDKKDVDKKDKDGGVEQNAQENEDITYSENKKIKNE